MHALLALVDIISTWRLISVISVFAKDKLVSLLHTSTTAATPEHRMTNVVRCSFFIYLPPWSVILPQPPRSNSTTLWWTHISTESVTEEWRFLRNREERCTLSRTIWHSRGSCSSPSPSSLSPVTELMWSLRRCLQVLTVASSSVVFWQSLRSNDFTFECSKYFNCSPFNPLFKKILLRMSFKFEGNVANFSNRIGLLLSVSLLTDKFIREGIRQWVIFFSFNVDKVFRILPDQFNHKRLIFCCLLVPLYSSPLLHHIRPLLSKNVLSFLWTL